MNPTLVNVSVPFFIEFVRRRCRNAESEIFWEDGTIAIRTVTAEQAPAVCHVCPGEKAAKRESTSSAAIFLALGPTSDGTLHADC